MRRADNTQRHVWLGQTGTGKTANALYELSQADWSPETGIPWVFVDVKGDLLFEKIRKACGKTIKEIDYNTVPKKPGIYYLSVDQFDMEGLEQWLIKVYRQGNVGLFIDEGYGIPRTSNAMNAIFTQGRAKNIPVMVLYQRPVYMTKFAIAQADFFTCLNQNMWTDKLKTYEYVPLDINFKGHKLNVTDTLPKYWSIYYDVGENEIALMKPTPPPDEVIKIFKAKLKPPKQVRQRTYV